MKSSTEYSCKLSFTPLLQNCNFCLGGECDWWTDGRKDRRSDRRTRPYSYRCLISSISSMKSSWILYHLQTSSLLVFAFNLLPCCFGKLIFSFAAQPRLPSSQSENKRQPFPPLNFSRNVYNFNAVFPPHLSQNKWFLPAILQCMKNNEKKFNSLPGRIRWFLAAAWVSCLKADGFQT